MENMGLSGSPVDSITQSNAALDYSIYQHACKILEQTADRKTFDSGYLVGKFHFSAQKSLLADLISLYGINLQRLAGEWLASTTSASAYGAHPLQAALKLITKIYPADK